MKIFCCECQKPVIAKLIYGREISPPPRGREGNPHWQCPQCGNYVECYTGKNRQFMPAGVIATAEIREMRSRINLVLDPLWKGGKIKRKPLYSEVAKRSGLGWYHETELRSMDEARRALVAARAIAQELGGQSVDHGE